MFITQDRFFIGIDVPVSVLDILLHYRIVDPGYVQLARSGNSDSFNSYQSNIFTITCAGVTDPRRQRCVLDKV